MCRFLIFKGREPILIADLLTRPNHSIIKQSIDSRLRMHGDTAHLNIDGVGVGWYDTEIDAQPGVFTSILPAWNNLNLTRLAEKLKSSLVFAHVRAATQGLGSSEANCHPFAYGRFLFQHNGNIAQFHRLKRHVHRHLRDEIFHFIQGTTDSEHVFALFLNMFDDPAQLDQPIPVDLLKKNVERTVGLLNHFAKLEGITEASFMNFAVTDGVSVVVTRYVTGAGDTEAVSLYFSSGTSFEPDEGGEYKMIKSDKREHMVIVASEPLTFSARDWLPVPRNHLLVVTENVNVLLYPCTPIDPLVKCDANSEPVAA